MKTSFLKITFLVLMMVILFVTGIQAKEEYTLKFAATIAAVPMKAYIYDQFVAFKNEVESKSHGRIKVVFYGGGQLGGQKDMINGVIGQAIEVASVNVSPLAGFYPKIDVLSIPYLFPNTEIAEKVLDGPLGQQLNSELNDTLGITMVGGAYPVGFRHFTNSKRPIHTPTDMEGLKFRVMQNPLYIKMVESLGASPQPIDASEMYMAMDRGVVDGQENAWAAIESWKFYEVQDYITLDGHVMTIQTTIMNTNYLKSLPEELCRIILEAARNSTLVAKGIAIARNNYAQKDLADNFKDIYAPSPSEIKQFKELAQPPVLEWLRNRIGNELVDQALSEVTRASNEMNEKYYTLQ